MRRLVIIAALALSLSACTMWKEPQVSTWKNTTSVEAMERLLWKEVAAQNWVEVEAHLASNLTDSTSAGVLDKAQTVARWRAAKISDHPLGEFSVTDHGGTTVVHYTATVGSGAPERHMSVWQKHKEGWVMVAHAEGTVATSPRM